MKTVFSLQTKIASFMCPLPTDNHSPYLSSYIQDEHTLFLPLDSTLEEAYFTYIQWMTRLDTIAESITVPAFIIVDKNQQPAGQLTYPLFIKAIGEAARNQEALLSTLLATMSEATTIVNSENHVMYWNKAAETLYQIPKEQMVGTPLDNHFASESLRVKVALSEGSAVQRLYHIPRPNQHVLINSAPIRQGDEIIGGLSIEQDITELVKLHEELTHTTAHLHNLQQEMTRYQATSDPFYQVKGHSSVLQQVIISAKKVATTDATVLITGESGVGKELFAQAIHQASKRADKPFIAINCGAIPVALFESELFGYQGGAFTGADKKGKPGKMELAHEGTLFLDEIGELPLELQVKLLRALQERQYYRVGGTAPITINTRIIAATNKNLEQLVEEGRFREDLFYRLNVFSLEIPSLRERSEDLPELIQIFLQEYSLSHDHPIPLLAPDVMQALITFPWPGNIRQLRNVMERLSILQENGMITSEHLPAPFRSSKSQSVIQPSHELPLLDFPSGELPLEKPSFTWGTRVGHSYHENEKQQVIAALHRTYGNKKAAATLLGISRGTLYNKMKKYGITEE
ncbi:sigma-54 interaction domain-containing protein [Brevibacillus daliensis]|uniref:sigma-54 interaction domain-containing protein n=1 Tax=Brevibacillus daliensis TaxID=2892995 RepID=UPI001E3BC972|nr:sigma 54-interacting transcriptional regulator [Brevibacillus daliensis]